MFSLNIFSFIAAFSVGIVACYLMAPKPKLVVRFPTPLNAGNIVYKDSDENCFVFKANKVQCTKETKPQPIIIH
jgi:hypothetical protein